MADLNYFTCTLGQAAELEQRLPSSIKTINDFLHHQTLHVPERYAVGFALPDTGSAEKSWPFRTFSTQDHLKDRVLKADQFKAFRDLNSNAISSACILRRSLASSPLGSSRDNESVRISEKRFETVAIPGGFLEQIETISRTKPSLSAENSSTFPTGSASDIAYFFHTSGTSTGLSKPISQDHHGAIGVLPCLPNGHEKATFTTTPLYHGGIADCFRAWNSGALIWLFPGKDVPITSSNVLRCLDCAERATTLNHAPPVKYFSSVPYVLQMVSSESKGLQVLQKMDIVGVGGAAIPQEAGDSLVTRGINLVSRFGSAECGFLLSSHRDYEQDKEWQYLRSHGSNLLRFEQQHDGSGLSELVIQSEWPHMAKRNREDGSLATADLFKPHPTIPNAWKYHSRSDSQLTLITGKKFDPAPLEAAIATSDLLNDMLIFGNGKPYPGALLFRSDTAKTMDASRLREEVWKTVDHLNKEGQPHTRISRHMLIVMGPDAMGLEKSSKGTIMRGQAEKDYHEQINGAYTQAETHVNGDSRISREIVPEDEVPMTVLDIIKSVLSTDDRISDDADLFSYGVDSVACVAVRARLQQVILLSEAPELPLNVIYDCGTIKRLSQYLVNIRKGRVIETEDELQAMRDMVAKYSNLSAPPTSHTISNGADHMGRPDSDLCINDQKDVVLLTGATGSLGAHILHILRSSRTTSHIICLVRASTPLAAHERITKALIARGKPGLPPFSPLSSPLPTPLSNHNPSMITCLPITLYSPTLGLSPTTYSALSTSITLIIHAAWAVNFTTRLHSFERDHIAGLAHLLALFSAIPTPSLGSANNNPRPRPPRFLFLSSTASVTQWHTGTSPIPERISPGTATASPLGYSRSKWVAESLCDNFHRTLLHSNNSNKKIVAVLRIGQLTGDTENGIWNMSEAWPLMLSTALQPGVGALPDLGGGQKLDWMPVDLAAGGVVEVADALLDAATGGDECSVFHILNPHTTPSWSDLLSCIKTSANGQNVDIVSPKEWLERLEASEGDKVAAKKLVGLWKGGFGGDDGGEKSHQDHDGGQQSNKAGPTFAVEKAREVSRVMRNLQSLSGGDLGRVWGWVGGEVAAWSNQSLNEK
ncbi:MAG: hypothetical protein Q9220_002258 [cf. Caloplaca sp. 1 TL-2023]